MTTEMSKKGQPEVKETKEITFKCKYCRRNCTLDDMRAITRFFPPVTACRDCAEKMQ